MPCGWPAGSQPVAHRGRRQDAAEVRDRRSGWRRRRSRRRPARPAAAPPPPRACGPGSRAPARRRAGARPIQPTSSGSGWARTCRKPALAPGPNPRLRGSSSSSTPTGSPLRTMATASGSEPLSTTTTRTPPGTSWSRNRATVPTQRSGRFQWRMTTGSTPPSWARRRVGPQSVDTSAPTAPRGRPAPARGGRGPPAAPPRVEREVHLHVAVGRQVGDEHPHDADRQREPRRDLRHAVGPLAQPRRWRRARAGGSRRRPSPR